MDGRLGKSKFGASRDTHYLTSRLLDNFFLSFNYVTTALIIHTAIELGVRCGLAESNSGRQRSLSDRRTIVLQHLAMLPKALLSVISNIGQD